MRSLLTSMMGQKTAGITPESCLLGKRIFRKLVNIFTDIKSIGNLEVTIFDSVNEDNAIQIEDGNIGINLLAVPPIFYYAYTKFDDDITDDSTDDITKCLVLCCPDYTTAWNKRKNLMLQHFVMENVEKELLLTKFALKLHPKSSETYAHRRWLFSRNWEMIFFKKPNLKTQYGGEKSHLESSEIESGNVDPPVGIFESLLSMAHTEFQICHEAARLQQSNYNAWAHKCWVINYVKSYVLQITNHNISVKQDYAATCHSFSHFLKCDVLKMMMSLEKHVSDVSISSSLMLSLSTWTEFALLCKNGGSFSNISDDDIVVMWTELLDCNSRLLQLYDSHETLWRHRTNLFLCINRVLRKNTDIFVNSKMTLFSLECETRFCESYVNEDDSFCTNTFAKNHLHILNKFYK